MILDNNLVWKREMDWLSMIGGGEQRCYRVGFYGLSVVNGRALHSYSYAWEAAVIKFENEDNDRFNLDYTTELSDDVEVFDTDEETNAFLLRAFDVFEKLNITIMKV